MTCALRVFLLAFILIASSSPTHAHTDRGRDVTWTQIDKEVDYNWEIELFDLETEQFVHFKLIEFGSVTHLTITTVCESNPEEIKTIEMSSGKSEIEITGCSEMQIIPDTNRTQLQRLKVHLMEHTSDWKIWRMLMRLHWWHGTY